MKFLLLSNCGCVSDWPTDGVVRHVQGCEQMRERGKERQQGN